MTCALATGFGGPLNTLATFAVLLLVMQIGGYASASPDGQAGPWVTYAGGDGPGAGKSIVLISGDEEYRSEEALPMIGRILSERHGFACRVVFAINPDTGEIDPDESSNIPGLEALADADLMIIATRFRDLPDEQMKHIDAYVRSGKPIIGIRTATHAFKIDRETPYRRYTFNYPEEDFKDGFGRQILGETWISHHGHHGRQSTRGVPAPGAESHAIVRGIEPASIWGPTDVYGVRLPLPDDCTPIVLGQVLDGMTQGDDPVDGEKNDPMMPIGWTKTHDGSGGGPRRAFTSTLGAASDFVAEGSRRMLVNAVYWTLEMEDRIPAGGSDVRLVGPFKPTNFGFGGSQRGMRPSDHAWPSSAVPTSSKLEPGNRIVVVGNTFAERLAQSGVFDAVVHAAHPEHELVIRHVPWSADEVSIRPREHKVPRMVEWIGRLDPDVVLMCFGMSESFSQTPEKFETDLELLLDRVQPVAGDDGVRARLILVSPIAHETGGPASRSGWSVKTHNETLAAITETMRRVAEKRGLPFVDLYEASRKAYRATRGTLTTNGIHPSERGSAIFTDAIARQLGWVNDTPVNAASPAAIAKVESLRTLTADQHWLWRLRYRATNTEYVWGRRHKPYGIVNFPPEMKQLDRMVSARDRAIWRLDLPAPTDVIAYASAADTARIWPLTPSDQVLPEDSWDPAPVEAKGTETSLGDLDINEPEEFAKSFTLPDGYVINCYASELDFPELTNPLAMSFDERGRLWVLCTPTYPHLMPCACPECKLLILEDTDRDGHADRRTVFADGLYIPTGFAIDTDGVYIGQAPDLLKYTDLDGDDRADTWEVVFSGFGMCDSHHQVSAFEWDPAGGLLFHEGVFTRANVETPYGTRRVSDAGVWRFDPRNGRLEIVSHCNFANPWGHVFDDFGASVLADASGGNNYDFSHVSMPFVYPRKPKTSPPILNRGRPTAGCEIISGRHFPEDVVGSFLVNQSIGYHGTRWDRLIEKGSTWATEKMPADMIDCSDVNFRPVGIEQGPDGALYILDWCNPIVGHMQYSVRDPRRDHTHGRVWRIRHETRPLVEPVDIAGASASDLLGHLRLPERNTRQHARRRLHRMEWSDVRKALTTWRLTIKPADPEYARLMLEDLWIRQAHGHATSPLLERVMALADARARAGAVRVIRYQLQTEEIDLGAAMTLLAAAVEDENMRVRFEGVVTCGFLPAADGVRLAARADLHEMDGPMTTVFEEVLSYLGRGGDVVSDVLERVRLTRMPAAELLQQPLGAVSAVARLSRSDLTRPQREEALAHLAGAEPAARAARLVSLIDTMRGERALRAAGEMLLSMPPETLAALADDGQRMANDPDPTRRAIGAALRIGDGNADADVVVDAMSMMDVGRVPASTLSELRGAVKRGVVEPMRAVAQVVRHEPDAAATERWLTELAADAAGKPLHEWDQAHERAMAAQAALAARPASADTEAYRIAPASAEQYAAGRAIYHDEALGCVRCHEVQGRGLEGYPPLDRSPWVVGNPRRAASIVVHGLYGPLTMPNGENFNSVMEPLGGVLDDTQIADVLTYVRQSWGNFAGPVSAAIVAEARAASPRVGIWETTSLNREYPLSLDVLVTLASDTSLAAQSPAPVTNPGAPVPLTSTASSPPRWLLFAVPTLFVICVVVFMITRSPKRG